MLELLFSVSFIKELIHTVRFEFHNIPCSIIRWYAVCVTFSLLNTHLLSAKTDWLNFKQRRHELGWFICCSHMASVIVAHKIRTERKGNSLDPAESLRESYIWFLLIFNFLKNLFFFPPSPQSVKFCLSLKSHQKTHLWN